jgi:IS5 family transposase
VPDATTVLQFRHWLEQHGLTKVLFDEVGALLEERGLLMRQGTIVDNRKFLSSPSAIAAYFRAYCRLLQNLLDERPAGFHVSSSNHFEFVHNESYRATAIRPSA